MCECVSTTHAVASDYGKFDSGFNVQSNHLTEQRNDTVYFLVCVIECQTDPDNTIVGVDFRGQCVHKRVCVEMTEPDSNLCKHQYHANTRKLFSEMLTLPATSKCCTIDRLLFPCTTKLTVGALVGPILADPTIRTPLSYCS